MEGLSADATRAALRPFHYFTSTDVENTRELISSVFCQHTLVPERAMQGGEARMNLLSLTGLGFGTLHLGGAMSVRVPEMSDYYLLLFCLRGTSTVLTDGSQIEVSGNRGFVCNPGQRFDALFSADAEQLFLRFDRRMLWRHTGSRRLRFKSDIDLSRPALMPAEASIRLLLSNASAINLMRDNPRIAREYEQLFVSLLLAGQPHEDEATSRYTGIAPGTVRRAEAFIRCNATADICLSDISEAVGVPVRTLLEGFRRFRETSPMRLLRDIRLELAHEAFSREDARTVADVAMGCGFGHLGRFAQAYTDRFGQRPSETRARGKQV